MVTKRVEIHLPTGGESLRLSLPAERSTLLSLAELHPTDELSTLLRSALEAPVGSLPLHRLARGACRVAIVVDDNTRQTPAAVIVPSLLDELAAAGLEPSGIRVIIAGGTHRPMTSPEIEAKLGSEVLGRVQVVQHDAHSPDLVAQGTVAGIPVWLNPWVANADLTIGVSSIVPHRYCGWSGGGKIIVPGVCGVETILGTHLQIVTNPEIGLGLTENPAREAIDSIATSAGLRFIVNTVLGRGGAVLALVAGDPVAAHREGVRRARGIYGRTVPALADIVVANAYPATLNLWQGGKALYSAQRAVRPGGEIILTAPCREGIGEHPEFGALLPLSPAQIAERIAAEAVVDKLAAAAAFGVSQVASRAAITLVSEGLDRHATEALGFRWASGAQSALDGALARLGKDARILVLFEGAELLPLLPEEVGV